MSRGGYLIDILARGFFIFVALYLVLRQWWWAVLISVGINVVYELTVGRRYWRAWLHQPRRPRRSWRTIVATWWHRLFARERTKGLVLTGLLLLFMSYFVRFNVYYVVVAGVVFTLAAISRFAPPTKSVTIPHESPSDPPSGPPDSPPPATK